MKITTEINDMETKKKKILIKQIIGFQKTKQN
jgi:hypothetical protein